ncbi:MAG: primosomal protein N', partial [Clostridia bacterium]
YPPFAALCVLRFSGEDDRAVYGTAAAACGRLRQLQDSAVEVLGPARAEMPKLNNKYRWVITLKGRHREELTTFLARWTDHGKMLKKIRGRTSLSISFDGR